MAAFTDYTLETSRDEVQAFIRHLARGTAHDAAFDLVWGQAKGIAFGRSTLARHKEIHFHRDALVALGDESNWSAYTWPVWNAQTDPSTYLP